MITAILLGAFNNVQKEFGPLYLPLRGANSLLGIRNVSSARSVSSSIIFNYINDIHVTVNNVTMA